MAQFDTMIKDGTIVDGTRVPRYGADVGMKNGKIAQIGRLHSSDAKQVIDASGLIVAPGFIDLHTHYDAQLHWDPYCTIGSWHGVTSATIGNCGFGALANNAIALTSSSDIELRSQPEFGHVDLLATPLHALRFEAHILEWVYTDAVFD